MKRALFGVILVVLALSTYAVRPAAAQTDAPPTPAAGPTGQVTGTLVNRNTGKLVTQSLEVMLHVLDKNLADKDMLHAQSKPDGTFVFADVPFDANLKFAAMAVYEGATYFSETVPADMSLLQASVEVPVYESTSDLSSIQVDQMHVVFSLAEDGLETKEVYVVSNPGDRTVKDAYKLENGKFAALEFPLPGDADYIFFKPEDQDRFVKLTGGFADTYPIPPGMQSAQFMVSYLVPYSGKRNYSYTAPMDIASINFLLPDLINLSIQGPGLGGPEPMTLQGGETYQVYTYGNLKAGQTLNLTVTGRGAWAATSTKNITTPIAAGASLLGIAVIGAGIWWWRKGGGSDDNSQNEPESDPDFDRTVSEIARLDQAHENGEIDEDEYRETREELRKQAKVLLKQAADNE